MKKLIVLPLLVAGTFAGVTPTSDSAKAPASAKSPKAPIPPSPDLVQWFAGATGGYLLDNECEFFSGHVGRDLNYNLGGWDTAAYLEVGYFGCDDCVEYGDENGKGNYNDYDRKYESYEGYNGYDDDYGREKACFDLDVIPVTLNYKLEREITNNLNLYLGAGAGVAFADLDSSFGSDDDIVFFGQAFAGALYQASDAVELYAGARLIYIDNPSFDIDGTRVDYDDLGLEQWDGIVEGGLRYNF